MMYQVAMIDPPWPQKMCGHRKARATLARELPYSTMQLDDIFALLDKDIFSNMPRQANVFMWTTDDFLLACEAAMTTRYGFKRHARIVWDKENGFCPAFSVRYSHEYLIWFYRGPFTGVNPDMRGKLTTVIRERHRQHSRKPDAAYEYVRLLFPDSSKIDVFSREKREGWDQYGDEKDKFTVEQDKRERAAAQCATAAGAPAGRDQAAETDLCDRLF